MSDMNNWLGNRPIEEHFSQLDRDGYVIFKNVLSHEFLDEIRLALEPYLEENVQGRNDFEGLSSNRVYAMLAKSPVFAKLATHPLALAFADYALGANCLLSACLAIKLHPGETAQPWHYDDSHLQWPRPRPSLGISAFWAIDETTEENGATELIPGSHLWGPENPNGAVSNESFTTTTATDHDPGARDDAIKAILPAGSLMLTHGTLWHRGGANRSTNSRLIITPQYCPGWTRQLENMALAVPPHIAKNLPKRARELIGYSIHSPFMGYVDGVHPEKTLIT